ncbi:MAG: hypothetical protein V3T81_09170 [Thermoanaerobaculia bacterium]
MAEDLPGTRDAQKRRRGRERRSGRDRREAGQESGDVPFLRTYLNRRSQKDRRSGLDRRKPEPARGSSPAISSVIGINTIFEHGGKEYRLELEDLGSGAAAYEVRVYDRGSVLWLKRISYQDLESKKLPKQERDQALEAMMEKTLLTVEAAISRGKIG